MKNATCAHSLDQRLKKTSAKPPGAQVVDQEPDRDPRGGSLLQPFQDRPASRVPTQDIGRDVDRQPRILDHPEDSLIRIDPIRHEFECDCHHGPAGRRTRPADARSPLRWNSPDRRAIGGKSGPSFAPADSFSARRTSRTAVHRDKAPARSRAARRSYCSASAAVSRGWPRKSGPAGTRDGSVTRTRARCIPR